MALPDFEPEFASATEWALFYRSLGLQVVPAHSPRPGVQWKRPDLEQWRQLEHALADDATFEGFAFRQNLGVIGGVCSARVIVLDLDHPKGLGSEQWMTGLLAVHNNGMQLETPTQRTGGGGLQLLLRWPEGRPLPSAHKTPIGVDIRGQGGFAVIAPSLHESGQRYAWLDGLEPWEVEIIDAPAWLCEEIEALLARYGRQGTQAAAEPGSNVAVLPQPLKQSTLLGEAMDGREQAMTDLVWAAMTDLRREHPFAPGPELVEQVIRESYARYESKVSPRLKTPGEPKHIALDREGRGPRLFREKCLYALAQWDGKLAEAAASLPAHRQPPGNGAERQPPGSGADADASITERHVITAVDEFGGEVAYDAETGEIIEPASIQDDPEEEDWNAPPEARGHELFGIRELLRAPRPHFLVDEMIIKGGLGFIYGPPGCGKSFWALDLALCVATGQKTWMGKSIQGQEGVLYLAGEGSSDAKLRMMAWMEANSCFDLDAPFDMVFSPLDFMRPESVEQLMLTIEAQIRKRGGAPAMIFVDTVSRVLPGSDENKQSDMTMFVKACDAVRDRWGCTVIGVHHVTKGTGQMRGSTVLIGAADFAFSLTRLDEDKDDEGGGQRRAPGVFRELSVKAEKIKAAPDGWTMRLELVEQACRDIGGSSSLITRLPVEKAWVDEAGDPKRRAYKDGWPSVEVCEKILADMREASAKGAPWTNSKQAAEHGRHAPTEMTRRYGVMPAMASTMLVTWAGEGVLTFFKNGCGDPRYPGQWSKPKASGYEVTGLLGDGRGAYAEAARREDAAKATGTDDAAPF